MVEPSELLHKLYSHSQAHRVFDDRGVQNESHRLCEAASFFFDKRARQVVQAAGQNAILYWYCNDGTELHVLWVHLEPTD